MWRNILKTVDKHISGERIFEDLKIINGYDRWFKYPEFNRSVRYSGKRFKQAVGNSKITGFPANGRSRLADYIVPKAWDARSAELRIISPEIDLSLSYEKIPNSLFMYSYPTKKGGITREVVLVKDGGKKENYKGLNVKGKIIFTYQNPFFVWRLAYEAGAIGILSSWKKGPGTGWVNYCFVPDSTRYKMFGFSLSETEGNKLEKALVTAKKKGKKVIARAEVDTKLFNGYGETVTSVIKGMTDEEILVFGHLYEIGAWDNASGSAAIIETANCLASLIKKGVLKKPKRDIRFMLGFECYSLMKYLLEKGRNVNKIVAGLNLDGVGLPVSKDNPVNINTTPDSNPAAANMLLVEIAKNTLKEKYKQYGFKINKGCASDDAIPGDPYFGIQFPYMIQYSKYNKIWHNSIDNQGQISKDSLKTAASIGAAYLYFLANAGSKESVYLAELVAGKIKADIDNLTEKSKSLLNSAKGSDIKIINKVLEEFREQLVYRCAIGEKEVRSALKFADKGDKETEAFILKLAGIQKNLSKTKYLEMETCAYLRTRKTNKFPGNIYKKLTSLEHKASSLVPERIVSGLITLETLPERLKTKNPYGPKYQVTGIPYLWADGMRNLLEIDRLNRLEKGGGSLNETVAAFEFLKKHGYVKLKRKKTVEVKKNALLRAVKKCGVKKGDVIFVHSSLNGLGHIDGGPDSVISILNEAVGREGTIVMPVFSWNFVDRNTAPFDKVKTMSKTGVITETFRRQKGVLRSNNPTHSVAARGKYAKEIVSAGAGLPAFDKKGPFGKLLELKARVIFLGCGLHSNSSLHAIEDWYDLPYLQPERTHYYDGFNIKHKTYNKMPSGCRDFYSHTSKKPSKIYKLLYKAGVIDEVKAGKGIIYSFEMQKFALACAGILKEDPLILLCDNKKCKFCGKFKNK